MFHTFSLPGSAPVMKLLDPLYKVPFLDNLRAPDEHQDYGQEHQCINPRWVDRVAVQCRVEEINKVREGRERGEDPFPTAQLAERDEDA